jgi:hypothetical protein
MAAGVKTFFRFGRFAPVLLAFAAGAPAFAQNSAPVQPLPGLDDFSLAPSHPTPRPTPLPTPIQTLRPSPRSAATPSPRAAVAVTPKPRPTPVAAPTLAPEALPSVIPPVIPPPEPTPTPVPLPTPGETLTPAPRSTPEAIPLPQPTAPVTSHGSVTVIVLWIWLGLAALVIAVAAGRAMLRKRHRKAEADESDPRGDRRDEIVLLGSEEAASAAAPLAPASATPRVAAPQPVVTLRATLALDFHARRAGTNLLSAAVDYTIVVRNTGAVDASNIRLDVHLLSAGRRQDALIVTLFAQPIVQSVAASFDLPPGGTAELAGIAMHPKGTLEHMDVGGKTLFVPVLAVDVRYDWDGGSGQTAYSYVVGIDRGDGAKLQPFRLDTSPRMFDTVGVLEYTVSMVS